MALPGNQSPWQSTGLQLQRGQAYSVFAEGRIQWSERYPHLHGGPRFHLWARIKPGGRAVNLRADTGTFVADADGTLELGIYMGMWADEFGTLRSSTALYQNLEGTLGAAVAVFDGDPLLVLESMQREGPVPALISAEAERLRHPLAPPSGWGYLHETGYADLYREEDSSAGLVIHAHADDDQGILRRAIDFPLTPTTTIHWRWRVDEHPSRDPEDQVISHDYISVAAELDNGRDLTWIWSSCLEPGEHFPCPVKVWRERETHFVIRSRGDSLGHWYAETRNVYEDVAEAMGPPPARVTGIWLIALSTFHHRVARASFTDITLANEQSELRVL